MKKVYVLGLALLTWGGCQTRPLLHDVSPRVIGRVVAADTGRPLAGVQVINYAQPEDYDSASPPKGGQLLKRKPIARTASEGRFIFAREQVLTPFGGSGWFSLQLFINQAGYERFLTNYSYLNLGTNTWKGQPVLDTGDIRLQPAAR